MVFKSLEYASWIFKIQFEILPGICPEGLLLLIFLSGKPGSHVFKSCSINTLPLSLARQRWAINGSIARGDYRLQILERNLRLLFSNQGVITNKSEKNY